MFLRPCLVAFLLIATEASFADEIALIDKERVCIELVHSLESPSNVQAAVAEELRNRKDALLAWATQHPNNLIIRHAVGLSLFFSEEYSEALPHLKFAFEHSFFQIPIGGYYSRALKKAYKPQESIRILERLVDDFPSIPQLRVTLAASHLTVQEYEKAKELLSTLLREDMPRPNRDYGNILLLLGTCDMYLGLHNEAVSTLEDAESYFPDAVGVMLVLSEAYIKSDRISEAEKLLRRSFEINHSHPGIFYWLGIIRELEGEPVSLSYYRSALASGEKRLQGKSVTGMDHYLLFQIHEKLGDIEKANRYKEQAEKLHFTFEAPWKQK